MIHQKKENLMRKKMVVFVLQGGRRSGGGGRIFGPAARVKQKEKREMRGERDMCEGLCWCV